VVPTKNLLAVVERPGQLHSDPDIPATDIQHLLDQQIPQTKSTQDAIQDFDAACTLLPICGTYLGLSKSS
jgi:hypothetical protein